MSPVLVANAAPDAEGPRLLSESMRRKSENSTRAVIATTACSDASADRELCGSRDELRLGQTRHVDAHGKDAARLREAGKLFCRSLLARGRHEKRPQIVSTQCAHGGAKRGEVISSQNPALRRDAHH